jgi:hypothetical protein
VSESFNEWMDRRFMKPEYLLLHSQTRWQRTGNPYFVWEAIEVCAEHKHELPPWVFDYLAGCATRMLSEDASQSKDFRKILPRVMGFPAKVGRGHHPLRPDGDNYEYSAAAWTFAAAILKGAKPQAALQKAADALLKGLSKIDDKTLRSHIVEYFGMTNAPRTNAEWEQAIRAHWLEHYAPFHRIKDLEDRERELDKQRAEIEKKMRDWIERIIARDPTKREQTISEVADIVGRDEKEIRELLSRDLGK